MLNSGKGGAVTHSLTIEVPENIYEKPAETANEQGRRVEDVALDKLPNRSEPLRDDPLDKMIGVIDSGIPDLAERHDQYIGEALARDLRDDGRSAYL
ncbi:MAG TPA: hypothetical protein PKD24_00205 [Pyrinomonadaceae bacterium]|nr:hypothetical protein [Pyrinomonadaceae bacterium]HMP64424.1 hypothetical protein [Pyrinomonadaceae bacterium]